MSTLGMKNGDNYALPDTNEVKKNFNMWAKAAENADAKTRLMNAGIIESTKNGYVMTDSFKKMIGIEEVDGVVKVGLTAKQLALNAAMQIGKQLLFSLGVTAAAFVASKIIDLTGLEDKYTSLLKKNDVTGKLEIQTSKFQNLMEAELKEAKIKGDNATAFQYNKILEWTDRNIQKQTMSYWDLVAAIEGYSAALEEAKGITDTFKDA